MSSISVSESPSLARRSVNFARGYERSFWAANLSELFERIAFYGMAPMLVVYLTEVRGFSAETAISIGGNFGGVTYGLAALSGFVADWLGYRRALMLAYVSLASGYFLVGRMSTYPAIVGSLLLVAVGASLVKPIITGTVQKTCSEERRAVGFSIYYMLVNVGGFVGPNIATWVRGAAGAQTVFYVSTAACCFALLGVFFAYREPAAAAGEQRRSIGQFFADFAAVLGNGKLVLLFLLVAGWWSMFFQFMNVLPLYLRDDLHVAPRLMFIPGLGAAAVMCFQVVVGYLVRHLEPFRAVLLALVVSSAGVAIMGIHASVVLAALGVIGFAIGEMIYSAHFYHYLGNIAPAGQTGMYMGFAFLPIALGSFLSGQIGGPVSSYFRESLHAPEMMWFAFASVGLVSAFGLWLLTALTRRSAPPPPTT